MPGELVLGPLPVHVGSLELAQLQGQSLTRQDTLAQAVPGAKRHVVGGYPAFELEGALRLLCQVIGHLVRLEVEFGDFSFHPGVQLLG